MSPCFENKQNPGSDKAAAASAADLIAANIVCLFCMSPYLGWPFQGKDASSLVVPLHLNEGPVTTAFSRRPAVIDDRIGDEWVRTGDPRDSSVPLSGP